MVPAQIELMRAKDHSCVWYFCKPARKPAREGSKRGRKGRRWPGGCEKCPKRSNKATRCRRINDLTQKTNPFQTQNKATKSFRFELGFWNKAKTKPPSPLDWNAQKTNPFRVAGCFLISKQTRFDRLRPLECALSEAKGRHIEFTRCPAKAGLYESKRGFQHLLV